MPFSSQAQRAYMHINEPEIADKWEKETPKGAKLPKKIGEEINFHVVTKPESHETDPDTLVHPVNPWEFAMKCQNGEVNEGNVAGFFAEEDPAMECAYGMVAELHKSASELEKKKQTVAEKLQKHIGKLHKEAEAAMREAKKDPGQADAHRSHSQALLEKIKGLEGKHKMVASSQRELKPLKEREVKKK